MSFLLSIVIVAFLCSIPFGLIIATIGYDIDPRQHHSHNIGMSNVWRCCGLWAAILTLIGDTLKAFVALWLCSALQPPYFLFIAFLCVFFHCFSLYIPQGGKGVASAGGVLLFLSPPTFGAALATWIILRLLLKKASLASLGATLCAVLYVGIYSTQYLFLLLSMTALILWRHKENIIRIQEKREFSF